jgi:hypothetical protein
MRISELDDIEKEVLLGAKTELAVEKASCDACGELKPEAGFKSVTVYGCEGDFCHDCRHGKNCNCGADDE